MTIPKGANAGDDVPLKSFRVLSGSVVIDLPFQPPRGSQVRAATLWLDAADETGWGSRRWEPGPGGRGLVPSDIDLGDVVGFAADVPAPPPAEIPSSRPFQRRPDPGPPAPPRAVITWYGYLHAVEPDGIEVRGPYPGAHDAYAAAQRALQAKLHDPAPSVGRGGRESGVQLPQVRSPPVELAQAPASVTVAYRDNTATVGDPEHGWIHVDSERLGAALAHTPTELIALLDGQVSGGLGGTEARLTLAALAARHVPDQLLDLTAPTTPPAAGPTPLDGKRPPTPDLEL